MSRHLIAGAGLVGGYIGGCLANQGATVFMLGRAHALEPWSDGIALSDYEGHRAQAKVHLTAPTEPVDVIWLTVKCHSVAAILPSLSAYMHDKTCIVACQNGLGSDAQVRHAFSEHPVMRGVIPFNVVRKASGGLHRASEGVMSIEDLPQAKALKTALNQPLLPVSLCDDMNGLSEAKLQLNLSNAVNALADLPVKQMLRQREYRRLIADLMEEWFWIVDAQGRNLPRLTAIPARWLPRLLRLPDWIFTRLAQSMLAMDDSVRTSMWWDLSQGKRTEVDYINGAVAEMGDIHGYITPLNAGMVRLIHEVEQGNRKVGMSAAQMRHAIDAP